MKHKNTNEQTDTIENAEQGHAYHNCSGHSKRKVFFIFGALSLAATLLIVAAMFNSTSALAGWGSGGFHKGSHGAEHRIERLLDKVNATDAQSAEIKGIVAKYKPSFESVKGSIHTQRDAIKQALTQSVVNAAELENIRAQTFVNISENSKTAVVMIAEIANVLTQEQRVELTESFGSNHRPW